MDYFVQEAWEFMLEFEIACNREIILVTNINGLRLDVLNDIIFCRTGYRDIDEYMAYEHVKFSL